MPVKLKPLKKIKSEIIPPPKTGEIVTGNVIALERSSVFLDLKAKGIGIIYGAEFSKAKDVLKNIKVGESISAKVVNLENEDGYRELSVLDASMEMSWKELKEVKEENQIIEVKIKKANKGGVVSEIKGIPAFLPVSHLSLKHYPKVEDGNPIKIAKHLQQFIGETLKVKIIDLDPRKEKLILSEKAKEKDTGPKKKEVAVKDFKVGDIVDGKISGITNFGAFIELKNRKGLEGLLYPSEISDKGKEKPEEALIIGQKVKAKIIKIANDRIYLSLKGLTQESKS